MSENVIENQSALLTKDVDEMTDAEKLERIIQLGFDGDRQLFQRFCETAKTGLPKGTGVALRGSVLTNERYEDGRPFDAKGDHTSDLDVTLIGEEARTCWNNDAYYIPALHTMPLGDKAPDIAPRIEPLRRELQAIVGRPVNIQATADIILYARDVLLGQSYYMIIEPEDNNEENA
jgi:hypothetical protein